MRKLIMLALLAAAVAATVAIPATANPRGTNGKILIGRADNSVTGQEQVSTVDPDGTDLSLLANDAEAGQWSQDGTRIALFEGILDFDTGVVTSLNLDTLYPDLFLPCGEWSPDDARLACEGFGQSDPNLDGIYTVRSSDGGDDCPSDYSPNGKRTIFTSASETIYALFTVKLDGSGMRQITPPGMNFNFCNGSWSPQGNEILFSAHVPSDEHSTIWVVHADGSGLRQVPVPGSRRQRCSETSTPSMRTGVASSG